MGIFNSREQKQREQQRRIQAEKKSKAFNQRVLRDAEKEVKRLQRYTFDKDVNRFVKGQKEEIKYRKNAIKENDKNIREYGRKKKWYEL